MIKTVLDVCTGLPRKGLAGERFAHGLAEYLQAVYLVVGLEKVDSLGAVTGKTHRLGPILARSPLPVHGDETVRRKEGVPQSILLSVIGRAVFRIPPEGFVHGWDLLTYS